MEGQPLAATVSVLKDELHYSPTMAVQSLARLLVIGRALGPERTRSELLPYLTSEIQQGNLNDEVHLAISGGLPQLVEFVGSAEEARGLLAPLRELCCAEDTAVRDAAVKAVISIGGRLPAALLAPTVVPMVLSLGTQGDWFTPRVSACGMLPLALTLSLRVEAHAAAAAAAAAPAASPPASLTGSLSGSLTASPGHPGGAAASVAAAGAAAAAAPQ